MKSILFMVVFIFYVVGQTASATATDKDIFLKKCSSCHGSKGQGGMLVQKKISGRSFESTLRSIKTSPKMKKIVRDLSEEEMRAAARFLSNQ